jgi:hypothetical protein
MSLAVAFKPRLCKACFLSSRQRRLECQSSLRDAAVNAIWFPALKGRAKFMTSLRDGSREDIPCQSIVAASSLIAVWRSRVLH